MLTKRPNGDGYSLTKGERALHHQLRIAEALRSSPPRVRKAKPTPLPQPGEVVRQIPREDSPGGTLPSGQSHGNSPSPKSQGKNEHEVHKTTDSQDEVTPSD